MRKWYDVQQNSLDVIMSCRVCLSRNISGIRFSQKLSTESAIEMVEKVLSLTEELAGDGEQKYYTCRVPSLRELDKVSLVERQLMSSQLAQKQQPTGIVVSQDDHISIMINEEDHLKIQASYPGMNLKKAYEDASHVDDFYHEKLTFAFDEHYGYLTSCPTNVGTGLKASVLLFLPALGMTGKIEELAQEVAKYGVLIKQSGQENTKNVGYLYELSNKATLGQSEYEIMDNLSQIAMQAASQEQKRREYLMSVNSEEIEDKVYRSYGVLAYAKKLSTQDAMLMLGQLKLGQNAGVIAWEDDFKFLQIMMQMTPANLQKYAGKTMNKNERDRYRAYFIQSMLPKIA